MTLLLSATLLCYQTLVVSGSIVIVTLPQKNLPLTVGLKNKLKTLPTTIAAAKSDSINNHTMPSIDSGEEIQLVQVDSGNVTCSFCSYSGNLLETLTNLTLEKRLKNVFGIAGLVHPNVLQTIEKFGVPVVSLIHFNGVPFSPNIVYMTVATSSIIESVIAFMKSINKSSIGLVTEGHHSYFNRLSEEFINQSLHSNSTISISFNIQHSHEFKFINENIISSQLQVMFISASPAVATRILCSAHKDGLVWPKYLWILHSIFINNLPEIDDKVCTLRSILEGVVILDTTAEMKVSALLPIVFLSHDNSCNVNSSVSKEMVIQHLTDVYFDAVSLLVNASKDQGQHGNLRNYILQSHNISGVSGQINFDNEQFMTSDIVLYQVMDCTTTIVAIYNGLDNTIDITHHITLPSLDTFNLEILQPTFVILYLLVTVLFILNTLLLLFYIYFRKDPDIKSTGVVLSSLIFIGCYFLIGFSLTSLIYERRRLTPLPSGQLCVLNTWLSGIGISVPLILSTLLIKMLRVYYIFTRTKRVKPGIFTSNCALLLYAVLLIVPNVIVLSIWPIVDLFRDELEYHDYNGFGVTLRYQCKSDHQFVFFGLLLAYFLLLSSAVVIVAIKTRKIRLVRFKDTKKVNLLIFLLLFIVCFVLSFWLFLARFYEHAGLIILCGGNLLAAFLCHVLLFAPKVWPPLKKMLSPCCPQKYRTVPTLSTDRELHTTAT